MFDKIRSYLLIACFAVIAIGVMAYIYVLSGGGEGLFGGGQGTLQPTDFEALDYRADDTGYLLCSTAQCPAAESDGEAEPFEVDATKLRQLIADYSDQHDFIRLQEFDFRKSQFEFLERLPGQTYPSVLSVRVIPGDAYSSSLLLYSFKPVGKSESTDHRNRVERWVRELHRLAQ